VRDIDQALDRFARRTPLLAGGQRRPLALQVVEQFEAFAGAGVFRQAQLCRRAAFAQGKVDFLQSSQQIGCRPETQRFVGIGLAHAAGALIGRQVDHEIVDMGIQTVVQPHHPVPAAQPAVEQIQLSGVERAGVGQLQHQDMQIRRFAAAVGRVFSVGPQRLPMKPFGFGDKIQIVQALPEFFACGLVAYRAPFQQLAEGEDGAQRDQRNPAFVRAPPRLAREVQHEGMVAARNFPVQAVHGMPKLAFHRARHARIAQVLAHQRVLQVARLLVQQHQHGQTVFRVLRRVFVEALELAENGLLAFERVADWQALDPARGHLDVGQRIIDPFAKRGRKASELRGEFICQRVHGVRSIP